jgi:hypothetical protein
VLGANVGPTHSLFTIRPELRQGYPLNLSIYNDVQERWLERDPPSEGWA